MCLKPFTFYMKNNRRIVFLHKCTLDYCYAYRRCLAGMFGFVLYGTDYRVLSRE